MTKYARDEFDRVPEASTRQGVHRTVAAPAARRLGPILATGAAALAVGLVAFLLLPTLGFGPAGGSAMNADQASNNAAASQGPTAGSKPSPSSRPTGSPAPAASKPTASAAPSASADAAGDKAIDKTQPVAVYNGTTTAGLAGRVGSTITAAGWAQGQVGNWGGAPQQTSVVFYNGPAQKNNAEALGALLGITTLVDSAEFQMPLVVVLGPGFK
mgnify:CR=1 FL=1